MSNAEIPGWMFPHHSVAFPGQLQNGVRVLLIDIHYGFPGAARIKTDLEVAVLSRTNGRRCFVRLTDEAVSAALAS